MAVWPACWTKPKPFKLKSLKENTTCIKITEYLIEMDTLEDTQIRTLKQ